MKGEGVASFVGDDFNFEGGLVLCDIWVGEGSVSDFIEGIRCIGDEFSKEDFFVGVEGVDDESHQLLDVSIEGKVLLFLFFGHI